MELFYRRYGEESNQPIIILHGLFGISDNWVSYARLMAMEGFDVFVVDQRNHGRSPHSEAFNYSVLADDLFDFIDGHGIEDPILIGHSMGGKVAMLFALENPHLVKKLVVVDIALKSYGFRGHHRKIMDAMKAVDFNNVKNRSDVENRLAGFIPEMRIRQFIMKNLRRKGKNGFEWRIFLNGLENNLDKMFDAIDTTVKFEKPTLFIRGGASDYILPDDYGRIRRNFPNAEIITMGGASHWVHVDAMERFCRLTIGFAVGKLCGTGFEPCLRRDEQKEFVDDLKYSIKEVEQHLQGKIELQSAKDFLNEL